MVKVGDSVGLVADEIIETVGTIRVDEAVAHPLARSYVLIDVRNDFKGGFDTIFICLPGLQGFYIGFAREAEDVEGFFAGQGDQLAGLRPVDLLHVSLTDQRT